MSKLVCFNLNKLNLNIAITFLFYIYLLTYFVDKLKSNVKCKYYRTKALKNSAVNLTI